MRFEQFFYDKFIGYEATPPHSVWNRILTQIEKDRSKGSFFYNPLEKKIIFSSVFACILSGILLLQFAATPFENRLAPIHYTVPQSTAHTLSITRQMPSKILPSSIASNEIPKNRNLSSEKRKTNSSSPWTKEQVQMLRESKKEINLIREVVLIDKQIDSMEKLQWADAKAMESPKPSPIHIENEAFAVSAKKTPNSTYVLENKPINIDKSETDIVPDRNGYYITPYFGGNFTQVFYQSEPNNPFFSDKTVFTGKLGYNFGLQAGYQFNKHWSIESGIGFGQYIQSFKENLNQIERKGQMYIDQIDIPLMGRFSINFGNDEYPKSFSFKSGLIYNSVTQYQVNYSDLNKATSLVTRNNIDADKRLYNSLELGYLLGFDFDAFISRKISLNISMLNALVSQFDNFPFFQSDVHRPLQYSSTFTIGTKIMF